MRLSTKMRYGSRAAFELAVAYPDGAPSVREIADRQCVSAKYLEHIMGALKAAGLARAVRGPHGGYMLTRPLASIKLSEIFRVLEGSAGPVDCVDTPDSCPMQNVCPTRGVWVEMREAVRGVPEHTTLQDLVERSRRAVASSAPTYQI